MGPGPLVSSLARLADSSSSGPPATMEEVRRLVAVMAAITILALILVVGLLITLIIVTW